MRTCRISLTNVMFDQGLGAKIGTGCVIRTGNDLTVKYRRVPSIAGVSRNPAARFPLGQKPFRGGGNRSECHLSAESVLIRCRSKVNPDRLVATGLNSLIAPSASTITASVWSRRFAPRGLAG